MRNKHLLVCAVTLAITLLWICASAAAAEKILHNFSILPHGANPEAGLIADAAGNLYGTTYDGGGYGVVFKLTLISGGTWTETVIHDFVGEPSTGPDGAYPAGALIFDASGSLYGTTSRGGSYGQGIVFKLTPTSGGHWMETIIHEFAGFPSDGSSPVASLIFDKAGNLYGTTEYGGNNDGCGDQYTAVSCGTVFELSPVSGGSWIQSVIHNFQGGNDGCVPMQNLTFDSAGNLYGSTYSNGGNGYNCGGNGTVFEFSPSSGGTWTESILYDFNNTNWGGPSGVIFDEAGNLYGTATDIVFELSLEQGVWTESTLYTFTGGADGGGASGNLLRDSSGNLYGTTEYGGISSSCTNRLGCGTVFELSPGSKGWTAKVLHGFSGKKDGGNPLSGVLLLSAGNLYATAASGANAGCYFSYSATPLGCGAVVKLTASSGGKWTAGLIFDFPSPRDGSSPNGNLISGTAGNLYGTTEYGGSGNCSPYPSYQGCGTVFELTLASTGKWKRKVLYSFTGINGDGANPVAGLIFDSVGNLYGTTESGGNTTCVGGGVPCGTVFELSPSPDGRWRETVIYAFIATDGFRPMSGLSLDTRGTLYGTTSLGGSADGGDVFQLVHTSAGAWRENVLFSFGQQEAPEGGLVLDDDGNFFGTTAWGGSFGQGAVFKLIHSKEGWTESVLHSFSGTDGQRPVASLIFDQEGSLYGTTSMGGVYNGGVVFKLTPTFGDAWTETVLYNFIGVNGDGAFPLSNLIFDNSGNLFGTTLVGGINGGGCGGLGCGTAFELTPSDSGKWKERVLHRFTGGLDGGEPSAGFILNPTGNLYTTTSIGGAAAQGIVLEVKP